MSSDPVTPENLTRKLLRAHLRSGELVAGDDVSVAVDQVLIEDATGTMCAMQFEMLGTDEIAVPRAVMYVDHNVLQIDDKNMQDHRYLRSFSQAYGLLFSPPGRGISHFVHLERFARPGALLLGADSHSTMAGAVGMFATGAGGLEVAVGMAGYGFDLPCPRVVGVELTGRLSPGVEAKDVILEQLRRHGVRGGRGAVFEFFGEGVATIPTTGRATICNMVVETGATAGVFPADAETRRWLATQGREEEFTPLAADPGAEYDEVERIDLSTLVPLVALPPSPGNVVPVAEAAGTAVVQVCVGSSVNSSYEDLVTVAAVLRDRSVAPGVVHSVIGDDDLAATALGQRWRIPDLGHAVRSGADAVTITVDGGRGIALGLPLSPGERTVLAAGGLLAHVRAGGRPRVGFPDLART